MLTLEQRQIDQLAQMYKIELTSKSVSKQDASILASAIARLKLTAIPLNPVQNSILTKYPNVVYLVQ